MNEKKYSAGIMSQSFWFNEVKRFLNLKKNGYNSEEIKRMVIDENLFGAPNEYRAKRMYGYIFNRANTIETELEELFFFF